jgi:hypothetical protein
MTEKQLGLMGYLWSLAPNRNRRNANTGPRPAAATQRKTARRAATVIAAGRA